MHGIGNTAWECNIQHIILVVTGITIDARTVASSCKRNTSLADQWRTVVAVSVTPDTVDLVALAKDSRFVEGNQHTSLSPQTTAMTLKGWIPASCGLKVVYPDFDPSLPNTT